MTNTLTDTGRSRASPRTEALTRLRERLLEELAVQVDQAMEQRRTAAELKTDPTTSTGQFELDRELAEAIVARSQQAIEDIESALARMEAGTYGYCERCAAPIPVERLEAIPHARFCVSCQELRDARR
jgi:RNA polymerase-binding protein DksA